MPCSLWSPVEDLAHLTGPCPRLFWRKHHPHQGEVWFTKNDPCRQRSCSLRKKPDLSESCAPQTIFSCPSRQSALIISCKLYTCSWLKNSPYKIQRLVFIPHAPGGPALIEQMSVVFRSMGSNGVLTSVTSLE